MKKLSILTLTMIALSSFMATTLLAQNVHLKPPNRNPSYTDNGLTLEASGNLAGLGNGDVLITLTATAIPTATCTNPGSAEKQPPGQNPAQVTVSGSASLPEGEIKNGNVAFSVTTQPPKTPIDPNDPLSGFSCPNPQWREDITDLAFTSVTITVEQPAGTLVFTIGCTFTSPTANGPVPGANVQCNQ
jgi:hypothetical protein